MPTGKKDKQAAPVAELVEWMVTLPHGESGHEVSFHPENVLVVDSAGPSLPRPGGGPATRTTKLQLSDGKVTLIYNVPLDKAEIMRRIREKLALLKAEQVIAGIRRQTVNDVVDTLARQILDHIEGTVRGILENELPERMRRFLMKFTQDQGVPGDERGAEATPKNGAKEGP
ncbi:MAG: hypothetical protein ACYTAN_14565 [Planctomycetota bacterium]|jgi:hypothetical protein